MSFVLADRVRETTTTTGTGTVTLGGAVTGFRSFSAIGNTNTCYYTIALNSEWETGIGTYTSSGTTLSRDTVLASSNSGSLVNFSAGTKDVFCDYPAVASMPIGVTMPYAGSSAPAGWLLCYGQAISRTTYAVLFALIGTTYGVGDGSTTFNMPDLRGRTVAGKDNMGGSSAGRLTNTGTGNPGIDGNTLGAAGGADRYTLATAEIPAHTHTVRTVTVNAAANEAVIGTPSGASEASGSAGSGNAHPITQPTIVLNQIMFVGV